MKISLAIFAVCQSELILNRVARRVASGSNDEKRYSQLIAMMKFYDPEFDATIYWAYGCNCLMLGDRPMSDPGLGPPVDEQDGSCKKYKDCQKCAKQRFGNECIGEFVKYKYGQTGGEKICENNVDTCKRAICECDLQFAKNHVETKQYFNRDFHFFHSQTGWNPEADCPASGGTSQPECCGNSNGPFAIFNALKAVCCAGEVQSIGSC